MSENERDILQNSKYMDTLAKIIIAKQNISDGKKGKDGNAGDHNVSVIQEYKDKLKKLDDLIDSILQSVETDEKIKREHQWKLDKEKLNETFGNGQNLEILEKDRQKYLLVPVKDEAIKKKRSKYKQKKKTCSYCQAVGHSKANCPKRLLNSKPSP